MVRVLGQGRRFILALILIASSGLHSALAIEVPAFTGPVVDLANVLTNDEQQAISSSLIQFQKEYGPQIATLILPTLEGEAIESFSIKVTDSWKLGDKKRDDGLL